MKRTQKQTTLLEFERNSNANASSNEIQRISRRQFILKNFALAATVALGEGTLASGHIQVTNHSLPMRGLKKPMRLLQMSDFHRSWCVSESFLQRVVDQANDLKPDVILLTGDFVTKSASYMESCVNALTKLTPKYGSYAVLGNHDYASDEHNAAAQITSDLQKLNIPVLTNRSHKLETGLTIVGIDDYWLGQPNPEKAFQGVDLRGAVMAMTHNPGIFPLVSKWSCTFVAGHTHGGQIHLPLITPYVLEGIGRKASKYLSGWFSDANGPGRLYVSRGLGVVGIPMRFRCDPEITLFDLQPA